MEISGSFADKWIEQKYLFELKPRSFPKPNHVVFVSKLNQTLT